MKTYKKMIIGYVLIALLLAAVGFISFGANGKIMTGILKLKDQTTDELRGFHDMFFSLIKIQALCNELMVKVHDRTEKGRSETEDKIKAMIVDFEKHLAFSKRATEREAIVSGEAEELRMAERLYDVLKSVEAEFPVTKKNVFRFIELAGTNHNEAHRFLDEELNSHVIEKVFPLLGKYKDGIQNDIIRAGDETSETAFKANRLIIAITFVAVIASVLSGFLISHSISAPITRLRNASIEFGEGRLDTKVDISGNDEIGELSESFNAMAQNLKNLVEERVKAAESLESALYDAEAANRAKSNFIGNLSHEIRTPLNAIVGFSQLVIDGDAGPVTELQKDYLKEVQESSMRLLSLINNLLELSGMDVHKQESLLSEFSLERLIEQSIDLFKEKSAEKDIDVKIEVEKDIGVITADERKIRLLMFQLLSNAIKFTPQGGSVSVSAQRVNSEQYLVNSKKELFTNDYSLTTDRDFIEISVVDTGIGISQENQKRLFDEPFNQLESPLTKKYSGVGVGLYLSKKAIEAIGGSIRVENGTGKGSRFVFSIPVRKPVDYEQDNTYCR